MSRYPPIADYALIGDCHTAALIGRDGGVDWLCPGRFDAPAVFCRLLDWDKGGTFRISPTNHFECARRYRKHTNILETTFTTEHGVVRLVDFMPIRERETHHEGQDVETSRELVRLVEGISGEVELEVEFKPTFDYALKDATFTVGEHGVVASSDTDQIALAGDVRLDPHQGGGIRGTFRIKSGERQWLTLGHAPTEADVGRILAAGRREQQLRETADYWERWVQRCSYARDGRNRERVLRSALALKLLIYEPSGGMVAAPTTSLPEEIGGVRNWDYRYTWLRDSALMLYALLTAGFDEEADDFLRWLGMATGTDPTARPQIMYGLRGERELPEIELRHLEGYRGSHPVRIGNAAAQQVQLDIYGEVLNAAYLHFRHRRGDPRGARKVAGPTWALLRELVDQAAEHWNEPDNGIWEVRAGQQHFLYSKLMCWSALDRGIRLAEEDALDAPFDRWRKVRGEIRHAILTQGYSERRGAFTQAFGSEALDATALAIPRIGFLPATDPRVLSTIETLQAHLSSNGLVYRYISADGLPGGEGTFLLCTFWMVDALALAGRVQQARDLYQQVCAYANDVGLMSEEVDVEANELLGNFPQGFTHLAVMGAAVNLANAEQHGAEHEARTEGERASHARRAASSAEHVTMNGVTTHDSGQ